MRIRQSSMDSAPEAPRPQLARIRTNVSRLGSHDVYDWLGFVQPAPLRDRLIRRRRRFIIVNDKDGRRSIDRLLLRRRGYCTSRERFTLQQRRLRLRAIWLRRMSRKRRARKRTGRRRVCPRGRSSTSTRHTTTSTPWPTPATTTSTFRLQFLLIVPDDVCLEKLERLLRSERFKVLKVLWGELGENLGVQDERVLV